MNEDQKQRFRAYQKAWSAANRDKRRATYRRYYAKNKEKRRSESAAYREAHRDAVRATGAARKRLLRSQQPEKMQAQRSSWVSGNRERLVGYCSARIAKIKGSSGALSHELVGLLLQEQDHRCPYCWRRFGDGLPWTLDHYMPLRLGGLHVDENIQLTCKWCNSRKSGKEPQRFVIEVMSLEGAI